jgi:hypothetical protein
MARRRLGRASLITDTTRPGRRPGVREPTGVRVLPCQHADSLRLTAQATGNRTPELQRRARKAEPWTMKRKVTTEAATQISWAGAVHAPEVSTSKAT